MLDICIRAIARREMQRNARLGIRFLGEPLRLATRRGTFAKGCDFALRVIKMD